MVLYDLEKTKENIILKTVQKEMPRCSIYKNINTNFYLSNYILIYNIFIMVTLNIKQVSL